MAKPALEPAAAYENLQLAAIDYLDHLCQLIRRSKRPDSEKLSWVDVHVMASVASSLADVAVQLDELATNIPTE